MPSDSPTPGLLPKVLSAVSYGFSTGILLFANKLLLTNFQFPSFLWVAISQMITIVVILFLAKKIGLLSFPDIDMSIPRKIFPLPLFFVVNLVSGLGGTQKISLPMFTVLTRLSIFLTMVLEFFILGVNPSLPVKISVFLMIFGAFVAAINDLAFDAYGYVLITIYNICTSANGVYMKKTLQEEELGRWGLLYYNPLFTLGPLLLIVFFTNDTYQVQEYISEEKFTPTVISCLIFVCLCGFFLNYCHITCTYYNSALTTIYATSIKNLFITYVGMVFSKDYIFTWANFIGVNISVIGSILYIYVAFRTNSKKSSKSNTVKPSTDEAKDQERNNPLEVRVEEIKKEKEALPGIEIEEAKEKNISSEVRVEEIKGEKRDIPLEAKEEEDTSPEVKVDEVKDQQKDPSPEIKGEQNNITPEVKGQEDDVPSEAKKEERINDEISNGVVLKNKKQ